MVVPCGISMSTLTLLIPLRGWMGIIRRVRDLTKEKMTLDLFPRCLKPRVKWTPEVHGVMKVYAWGRAEWLFSLSEFPSSPLSVKATTSVRS